MEKDFDNGYTYLLYSPPCTWVNGTHQADTCPVMPQAGHTMDVAGVYILDIKLRCFSVWISGLV